MHLSRRALLAAPLICRAPTLLAQPAPISRPSLDIVPVASHRFENFAFVSIDGLRRYRITAALPRTIAPAGTVPALYLCDGNAALTTLTPDDLAALGPIALIALGYDTVERYDLVSRNYDYTPAVDGDRTVDELRPENRAGGASLFADLLATQILPTLEASLPLDPARRGLWGHSYGGLFTLVTLFERPNLFKAFVPASPSLWWYQGRTFPAAPQPPAGPRFVHLSVGTAETNRRQIPGRQMPTPQQAVDLVMNMAERLRQTPNLTVTAETIAGLDHGPMFAASLTRALEFARRIL